ncbi:MAG TPA: DUF1631 family protein, partial [Caldimonas sp.]|nr:DUF1631 family protein [Caldimonas sp.]
MPSPANPAALAQQARRTYAERLLAGMPAVVQAVEHGAHVLAESVAEPAIALKRRELVPDLHKAAPLWLRAMNHQLRGAVATGLLSATSPADLPPPSSRMAKLTLVDDDTIEHEILSSRLALAMMDRASWEFTDLRARMNSLEGREELDPNDILRPHVLARLVTSSWLSAGLRLDAWRTLQAVLHDELSHFTEEAYHETNRWLLEHRVLPDTDLRPFIRRARDTGRVGSMPPTPGPGGFGSPTGVGSGLGSALASTLAPDAASDPRSLDAATDVHDETRLLTRQSPLTRGPDPAEAVLNRLNRLVGRQLPEFGDTSRGAPPASPGLNAAINQAQQTLARRLSPPSSGGVAVAPVSAPQMIEELQQRKQQLKQAASTPGERATIELVALLFQTILTDDRIPATIRVWFARLQMPVLR